MMRVFLPLGRDTILRPDYGKKLQAAGMTPALAYAPEYKEDDPEKWHMEMARIKPIYDACNGVLLIGGTDIHPYRYAKPYDPLKVKNPDAGRDAIDVTTLDWAYDDKKPILGICRGAQVIGVHRGLHMEPHIPDVVSTDLEIHSKEEVPETLKSVTENEISILEETLLYEIVKTKRLKVKCAHHQAVQFAYNSYLRLSGISDYNIPEAWESRDQRHFCLGVQFHPELGDGLTDNIFFAFKSAIEMYWLKSKKD